MLTFLLHTGHSEGTASRAFAERTKLYYAADRTENCCGRERKKKRTGKNAADENTTYEDDENDEKMRCKCYMMVCQKITILKF